MPKLSKEGVKRQTRLFVVNLLRAALVAAVIWFIYGNIDWYAPKLTLNPEVTVLGPRTDFVVKAEDKDTGIRDIRVTVQQEGQEKEVLARTFPAPALWGFGSKGSRVMVIEIPFTVDAKALGLKDGKATLVVQSHDYSWRNHFQGRLATLTREVDLALVPLKVSFLGVSHLLKPGGSGLILYRLNKPARESGALVGPYFYQGFPHPQGKPEEYVAIFPVPQDAVGAAAVELVARPLLGQEVRQRVALSLKPRKWRSDRLNLSDDFIRKVAATFPPSNPGDLLSTYLKINRDLRKVNHERVRQVCAQSQPQPLWSGAFLRFLGKPMARFGDRRTYVYEGRTVDQQVHLGEDLASLEHSAVAAGNRGVVVLAAPLGIYGQTVILDHGLGVFSMYGHLSQIAVKAGDQVDKGGLLGRTGATGLAGGDHLHFAMILQGEFVDPVEWWDPHWLKDQVEGLWGRSGAPPPEPGRASAPRKKKPKYAAGKERAK
jgi:murein DD-endopeptidase MepM/ murein hydrolase activator NlpD